MSVDVLTTLAKSGHGNAKAYLGLSQTFKMERLMKIVLAKKRSVSDVW